MEGGPSIGGDSGGAPDPGMMEMMEFVNDQRYDCLIAIGVGAVSTALDPISLVATGTAGVVTSARAVSRAAFPAGRALILARAALPGFAIATAVSAALGGVRAFLTDPSCR